MALAAELNERRKEVAHPTKHTHTLLNNLCNKIVVVDFYCCLPIIHVLLSICFLLFTHKNRASIWTILTIHTYRLPLTMIYDVYLSTFLYFYYIALLDNNNVKQMKINRECMGTSRNTSWIVNGRRIVGSLVILHTQHTKYTKLSCLSPLIIMNA